MLNTIIIIKAKVPTSKHFLNLELNAYCIAFQSVKNSKHVLSYTAEDSY